MMQTNLTEIGDEGKTELNPPVALGKHNPPSAYSQLPNGITIIGIANMCLQMLMCCQRLWNGPDQMRPNLFTATSWSDNITSTSSGTGSLIPVSTPSTRPRMLDCLINEVWWLHLGLCRVVAPFSNPQSCSIVFGCWQLDDDPAKFDVYHQAKLVFTELDILLKVWEFSVDLKN